MLGKQHYAQKKGCTLCVLVLYHTHTHAAIAAHEFGALHIPFVLLNYHSFISMDACSYQTQRTILSRCRTVVRSARKRKEVLSMVSTANTGQQM